MKTTAKYKDISLTGQYHCGKLKENRHFSARIKSLATWTEMHERISLLISFTCFSFLHFRFWLVIQNSWFWVFLHAFLIQFQSPETDYATRNQGRLTKHGTFMEFTALRKILFSTEMSVVLLRKHGAFDISWQTTDWSRKLPHPWYTEKVQEFRIYLCFLNKTRKCRRCHRQLLLW